MRSSTGRPRRPDIVVRAPVVIDARDHGLPQRRRRVFILGRSKRASDTEGLSWPPSPDARKQSRSRKGQTSEALGLLRVQYFRNLPDGRRKRRVRCTTHKRSSTSSGKTPPNGGGRKSMQAASWRATRTTTADKDVYGQHRPAATRAHDDDCLHQSLEGAVRPSDPAPRDHRQAGRAHSDGSPTISPSRAASIAAGSPDRQRGARGTQARSWCRSLTPPREASATHVANAEQRFPTSASRDRILARINRLQPLASAFSHRATSTPIRRQRGIQASRRRVQCVLVAQSARRLDGILIASLSHNPRLELLTDEADLVQCAAW